MTIPQRIFETMKEKGITQSELSRKSGVSTSTISDWKNKNKMPSSNKLSAIAEALGVPIEYLVNDTLDYINRKSEAPETVNVDSTAKELLDAYSALSLVNKAKALSYICKLNEEALQNNNVKEG